MPTVGNEESGALGKLIGESRQRQLVEDVLECGRTLGFVVAQAQKRVLQLHGLQLLTPKGKSPRTANPVDMDIKDKVAIVTGGGSGIGRATCLRLAELGARVIAADVNLAGAEETAQLCGGRAYQVDVTSPQQCADLIHSIGKVDILHNNAGLLTNSEDFLSAPPDRLVKLVNTNLAGLMLLTQAAAHAMTGRGGVIVNTASVSGLRPWPLDPIYSASKAGVVFFTRAVAEQLQAHNIRVNAVCPGLVRTPMAENSPRIQTLTPEQRQKVDEMLVDPSEVVDVVVEFIQDDSLVGEARFIGKSGLPPEGKLIRGL